MRKAGDLIDEMYAAGLPDGEGPVLAAKDAPGADLLWVMDTPAPARARNIEERR